MKFAGRFLMSMFLALHVTLPGAIDTEEAGTRDEDKRAPADLEAQLQEHAAQIAQLRADLAAQQNLASALSNRVSSLESENQVLSTRINVMGRIVAFHVDFGAGPYGEVDIGRDDPVRFNRTNLNVGAAYDNATGVFTTPYAGLYSFTLHIMGGTGAHDDIEVGIFTTDGWPHCVATAEGAIRDPNDKGSCTAILELQQGDQVYAKHNYGGTFLWGSLSSSFLGMLVKPQ